MTYTTTSDHDLSRKQVTFVQSHASKLADLPPPSELWTPSDIPEYLRENLRKYEDRNIIECVERATDAAGAAQTWRTTADAWAVITESAPTDSVLPCNHSGFTNTGATEKPYQCTTCGVRYRRDQLTE